MKEQIQEQMKLIFEVMGSEEFTEAVASFAWNMFTKLKSKGFTESQAIKIVTGMSKAK